MWLAFARTRRRLMHGHDASLAAAAALAADRAPSPSGSAPSPSGSAAAADRPASVPDMVLTIGRVDLDRLGTALQALLGADVARPDTPARLEVALAAAVERLGGAGRPRVTRRPAGLSTPEAWQVRLTSIDPAIGEAIRSAARGLGFSP